jgi:hypothetical protein
MGRGGLQALCRRALGKERACRQKGIFGQEKAGYEPIKNSGLFEKLLYLGRNRSVSY